MSSKFLYRRLGPVVIVLLAFFAVAVPPVAAQRPQLKRPNDEPAEKPPAPPPKKKIKGPRALAVLQFGEKSTTLIPIAILVDGRFYDASAYKAEPVPMALVRGTVYEAEQSGESKGLFTINGALHSKSPNSPHPWLGSGSYLPNGTEAAKTTHKAEDKPIGIDSSGNDEPPRLTRGDTLKPATSDSASAPSAKPSSANPTASGSPDKAATTPTPPASQPGSGASSNTPANSPSGQDAPKNATPPAPDKAKTSSDQTSSAPDARNYYRPTLRRGKPTEPAPPEVAEDEAPQPVKAEASTNSAAPAAPPALKLVPAISDEGGPELRSYTFFWKTGEEDDRRTQMLALAAANVRNYAAALVKNRISAKPMPKPAPTHKPPKPAKPVHPEFENIRFRAFDLWGKSQPVMILTAEAHLPAAPGATALPENYSVALAATTDIYGNLRPLYTGVTDKFHLDVTPELQLIDAVDADGDGRGELLFSETTDAGTGYVIYRATADKLWKLFDSLGGE
jgi:hypothetical protein